MKTLIKAALFLTVAVITVRAQAIKATIPFEFEANGKTMPAGEYSVLKTTASSGGLFALRNIETHDSVLLSGRMPIADSEGPVKLVFDRAADSYYLTELWDGSMGRTLQCPRGRYSILASTKPATRVVVPAHK